MKFGGLRINLSNFLKFLLGFTNLSMDFQQWQPPNSDVIEIQNPSKRMKIKEENPATDRLSTLPDVILLHILSLLDIKQAVEICLSFKSWKHLWTLLPDMDFDISLFQKVASFDAFVDQFLSFRDDSVAIYSFGFSRGGRSEYKFIDRITKYAASHGVQHFKLTSKQGGGYSFPVHLCSCDSLKSLKLQYKWSSSPVDFNVSLRRSLSLKHLVTLYLQSVDLDDREDFSGCPCLENLTLIDCQSDSSALSLVGHQLLTLTISWFNQEKLMLSTPKLRYLKVSGPSIPFLQTDALALLDTVVINLYSTRVRAGDVQHLVPRALSIRKFVENAKSIKVYPQANILADMLSPHRLAEVSTPD